MSKKIRVGDKVVPISKSVYRKWDDCPEWQDAVKSGQNFLYVRHIYEDGDISCTYSTESDSGSIYRERDLTLYKGSTEPTFGGKKLSVFKAKEILDLINKGIIKEDDSLAVIRV